MAKKNTAQEAEKPATEEKWKDLKIAVEQGIVGEDTLIAAQSGIIVPDYWRQLDLFAPEKFGNTPVHVVGVGATGSYVAYLLAKLGIRNIHIYDFDFVEDHNLPNQLYRLKDVGRPKVEALSEIIEEATGIKVTKHFERVTGQTKLEGYVFLLVDSMKVRLEIWQGAIKFKIGVKAMIETRMAIDNGRIFVIIPTQLDDVKIWESNYYDDSDAEPSVCSNQAVGPTVALISAHAVWKLIKLFNGEEYGKQVVLCCRPSLVVID